MNANTSNARRCLQAAVILLAVGMASAFVIYHHGWVNRVSSNGQTTAQEIEWLAPRTSFQTEKPSDKNGKSQFAINVFTGGGTSGKSRTFSGDFLNMQESAPAKIRTLENRPAHEEKPRDHQIFISGSKAPIGSTLVPKNSLENLTFRSPFPATTPSPEKKTVERSTLTGKSVKEPKPTPAPPTPAPKKP